MHASPDPTPVLPTAPHKVSDTLRPPGRVRHLQSLIDDGRRFPTIYADPPWQYANRAARGAAERHYRTMTLDDICRQPVAELAADDAHLHLWTTNGFLKDAFRVIEAWGFRYKSCFVWVKPELGCGNYYRVSHEFLLLGVRGRLPFRNRTQRSWQLHPRREHSRKPEHVRLLIEQVSPGPYLELFGRTDVPDSEWTVFGNQVDRRLF
jgi:N6-adenosine-specific RNA methylase IME4